MPADTAQALEVLSGVTYFAALEPAVLALVCASARRYEYACGDVVLLEGEPVPGLYVVKHGWLKAVKISLDGREQVLHLMGPGETFNAVSVFTDTPSPATVSALESCELWMVGRQTMLRLLDEQPVLARLVIQDLAGRVLHLVGLVEDLSLRSVEARLAHLLLRQAHQGTVLRQSWATQSALAARLGTVPDVLNRILRRMVETGLIRLDRQSIQILDQARLEAISAGIE